MDRTEMIEAMKFLSDECESRMRELKQIKERTAELFKVAKAAQDAEKRRKADEERAAVEAAKQRELEERMKAEEAAAGRRAKAKAAEEKKAKAAEEKAAFDAKIEEKRRGQGRGSHE